MTDRLRGYVNFDRLSHEKRHLIERSIMNETLAVQTRNKVAKVYLGGIVAFSGIITLLVSIVMIVNRTN
jgi:hypothetical protein